MVSRTGMLTKRMCFFLAKKQGSGMFRDGKRMHIRGINNKVNAINNLKSLMTVLQKELRES